MKQRLGVALAILGSPDLILLDEPTNGLDPVGIIEMREMLTRLSEQGVTVLISSHILAELAQIATKYAIVHKGKLVSQLTQTELAEHCKRAVSITVDDAPKATVILETKLNIHNYKQVSASELRVYESVSDTAELTFQLSNSGVRVSAVKEVGDTLEDFFLKAIGEVR
jgi:ABC-2 type transport system ATP-binding protein